MALIEKKINKLLLRLINKIQYPFLEIVFYRKRLYVYCFCDKLLCKTKKNNIGDDLNIDFLEVLFAKKIIKQEFALFQHKKTYSFIGSILEYVCKQNESVTVWGTGFKYSSNNLCDKDISKNKYLAVRGPLTRDIVLKSGGSCPAIYGDPGILISRYIKVERKIKYKFGIIPHKSELKSYNVKLLARDPNVLLLDLAHYVSLKDFLEQLNSCECILSSSLHGLIFADSYNIPNLWVRFSPKVDGDGFKYHDYYEGVKKTAQCIDISTEIDMKKIENEILKWQPIKVDENFIKSCPFKIQ